MYTNTFQYSRKLRGTCGKSRILGGALALAVTGGLIAVGGGAASASDLQGSTLAGTQAMAHSRYSFTTLNDNADPTFNQLLGINNSGTIAGYFGSGAAGHPNRGYRLLSGHQQGDYRNENFPGSAQTQVVGINNTGLTAGFFVDGAGANTGFLSEHGHFLAVSNPRSNASPRFDQLLGVNDQGTAVGFYNDAAGNAHGYTFDVRQHRFHAVNVQGASAVTATGINDHGDVTGFAVVGGTTEGFVKMGHQVNLFKVHGSANTQALGINGNGSVVGSYVDAGGATHGFVLNPGRGPVTVDDPHGVNNTVVNGINDNGNLVGFYVDAAGNTDGMLAIRR